MGQFGKDVGDYAGQRVVRETDHHQLGLVLFEVDFGGGGGGHVAERQCHELDEFLLVLHVLEDADDDVEQGVVFEQFLSGLRADVGHKGQDLEDLFLNFNRNICGHEHSQQGFDILRNGRSKSFIPLINQSP